MALEKLAVIILPATAKDLGYNAAVDAQLITVTVIVGGRFSRLVHRVERKPKINLISRTSRSCVRILEIFSATLK